MTETIEQEAVRRFAWAFPPESDKEDMFRARKGQGPREWEPTRQLALEQVIKMRKE